MDTLILNTLVSAATARSVMPVALCDYAMGNGDDIKIIPKFVTNHSYPQIEVVSMNRKERRNIKYGNWSKRRHRYNSNPPLHDLMSEIRWAEVEYVDHTPEDLSQDFLWDFTH